MKIRTQYHNLTDDELLAQVNVERNTSDIIEELCQRIEILNNFKNSINTGRKRIIKYKNTQD